ncbi:hypothetical protein [Streptomyces sp. NRRL F-2580]|uniref:hypothetical protein n=1 Tax=Streptomyces sp. NRRL F-2580 TaxID=1463841 RepID=UPI00131D715A|nr:hypothetical protein [Streptomyces sp. NRRL F-2580]
MSEVQKVSARQTGWAVAAVVVAAAVTVGGLIMFFAVAELFVFTALAVAIPLQLRKHPKAFARTCIFLSSGLLVWGVFGLLVGMFLFLPAAVLLLFAALADADNRPGGWWVAASPIAAALALALAFAVPSHSGNEQTFKYAFYANLDSVSRLHDPLFNKRKERLKEFGATNVSFTEKEEGRLMLTVQVPEEFHGQVRHKLEWEIMDISGVVALCYGTYDASQQATCEPERI